MHIDEFESQFKSALKEIYKYSEVNLQSVLVVSDLEGAEASQISEAVFELLPTPEGQKPIRWELADGSSFSNVKDLVARVDALNPSLIVAQRNLKWQGDDLVYGLTSYIDALTQVCVQPVLLLPDAAPAELRQMLTNAADILVESDHLTGDSTLINWGLRFAAPTGRLVLTHIEDENTFQYYIDVISKIPELDTDLAQETIRETLLKLPREFVAQAKEVISAHKPGVDVISEIRLGRTLEDYRRLLESHRVNMVVINTKEHGQLAMGGMAYAIAVEFKQLPLLML